MFVAINRLRVPTEYAGRLEEGFTRSASGMDGVSGFVSFDLLKAESNGEYVVVTRWQDRDAFDAWRRGDAFLRSHGGANPNSPVTSELSTYTIVLSRP